MSDRSKEQFKRVETRLAYPNLKDKWKIFGCGFLQPLVIIPIITTLLSLYFANSSDIDKTLSLVLQIIAVLLLAIAGGFFYDEIRNITGRNILTKKGLSAVRNLALARTKTNNISDRVKANATAEEIRNLLSLLEKDQIILTIEPPLSFY